jgi:hypothetical protein
MSGAMLGRAADLTRFTTRAKLGHGRAGLEPTECPHQLSRAQLHGGRFFNLPQQVLPCADRTLSNNFARSSEIVSPQNVFIRSKRPKRPVERSCQTSACGVQSENDKRRHTGKPDRNEDATTFNPKTI